MSSKINSKDIIIKQKEKVSSLDWSDFLQSEFDKPAFDSFISKLITNMEKGIKFQPPMKDWFSDFFNVSFADLKVVLVSKDGYSLNDNFAVPEELNKQGVMFFPLERTVSSDGKSHLDSWRLFNTYVIEILTNKSIHSPQKDGLLIRKKTFDLAIDKFIDKFPDYWTPSATWTISLKDLVDYIANMKKDVEVLEIHKIVDKNVTYEFYNSNNIKKMLKFNY
jgi:hypothetical protein